MQNYPRCIEPVRRRVNGAISLCLMLCCAGCAPNPLAEVRTTHRERPPASLLLQNPVADWPAANLTNGELLELSRAWRRQAIECNADKAAIDAWAVGDAKPAEPQAPPAPWWKIW